MTDITRHVKAIEELQSRRSQAALNRKLCKAYVNFVQSRFDKRKDPSGRKWKARKSAYAWPILEKSGDMRDSLTMKNAKIDADGFSFAVPEYTKHHQDGTKHMVARRVYPSRQLPRELQAEFSKISREHTEKRLKSK